MAAEGRQPVTGVFESRSVCPEVIRGRLNRSTGERLWEMVVGCGPLQGKEVRETLDHLLE